MLVLVSYETLHLPWLFSLVSFNKTLIFKRYELIFLSYGTGHMGIQLYFQSLILDISVQVGSMRVSCKILHLLIWFCFHMSFCGRLCFNVQYYSS